MTWVSFAHAFHQDVLQTLLRTRSWAGGRGLIPEQQNNPRLWTDSARVSKQHHWGPHAYEGETLQGGVTESGQGLEVVFYSVSEKQL